MAISAATAAQRLPGPLERTSAEQELLRRRAAFHREHELRTRRRLRESDRILDLVEECRLRGIALLPIRVWAHVVRFVGSVDAELRDDLGIDRHPDHVTDVIFSAQEALIRASGEERRPRLAPVIPLFGSRPAQ